MVQSQPYSVLLTLVAILLTGSLSGQTKDSRWAISAGAAASKYNGTAAQPLPATQLFFPSAKIGAIRYLRPGFNFRTQAEFSPSVIDPLSTESSSSQYFSFQYAFIVKFNNGIILREDARIAPYLLGGAGGSYHAASPDAYSPLGAGISVRINQKSAVQLEVNRNISWNKSPQVLSAGINYTYFFRTRQASGPVEQEEIPTEDIIASQRPSDSDGDGVPDTEDLCPYDAGFIQNDGCPEQEASAEDSSSMAVVAEETLPAMESPSTPPPMIFPEESEEDRISAALEEEGLVFSPENTRDEETPSLALAPVDEEELLPPLPLEEPLPANAALEAPCAIPGEVSVLFQSGSSDLSVEDQQVLDGLASSLKECPEISLTLVGYADESGSEDDNLVLSIKRAFNVKYYLVYEHGISQRRIMSKGKGSKHGERPSRSVSFSWSS